MGMDQAARELARVLAMRNKPERLRAGTVWMSRWIRVAQQSLVVQTGTELKPDLRVRALAQLGLEAARECAEVEEGRPAGAGMEEVLYTLNVIAREPQK